MSAFIQNISAGLVAIQIVMTVTLAGLVLYLRRIFVTRGDFGTVTKKLQDNDDETGRRLTTQSERIQELAGKTTRFEDRIATLPNAEAMKDLELAMERLSGRVLVLDQKLEGFDDLHQVLSKQVDRMDEFLRTAPHR